MINTGPLFARLRALYPEELDRIKADEDRVQKLLRLKEYASLPETAELISLCRKDIVTARMRLATTYDLDEAARAELWLIIRARQWFLGMVARDYDSELTAIERELRGELEREP